jgi:hypothetical protein
MTFGPALSLGVSSLCEVVDLKIGADLDAEALLDSLTNGAQPGLRFVRGTRLGSGDAAVTRILNVARYVLGFPRVVVDGLGGEAWLAERLQTALASETLPVVRRIEGIGKRVDVRSFLRVACVGNGQSVAALQRAGIVGDLLPLDIVVDVRGSGGVKAAEVVEAVFGDGAIPNRAVRVELGTWRADGSIAPPIACSLPSLRERFSAGGGRAGAEQP